MSSSTIETRGVGCLALGMFVLCQRQKEVQQEDKSYLCIFRSKSSVRHSAVYSGALHHNVDNLVRTADGGHAKLLGLATSVGLDFKTENCQCPEFFNVLLSTTSNKITWLFEDITNTSSIVA